MWEEYIYCGTNKLRKGYTTGTCAAAAVKACMEMILGKRDVNYVKLCVPSGDEITLDIIDAKLYQNRAVCAVKKDSGDDPDVTDGILVYADVKLIQSGIKIDGGKGVGKVTKKGLDIPVGNAAINKVPLKMITESIIEASQKYGYSGGADVVIFVPEGEAAAKKTFNPNLGIEGGISILGTSGIVEPMSEKALVETINAEIRVIRENEGDYLIFTPGNYGISFISDNTDFDIKYSIKVSNFIGDAIDFSVLSGIKGILIVGHLGKMIKLAGGVMNTHSKNADCRMEIMTALSALCGIEGELLRKIYSSLTVDMAMEYIFEAGKEKAFFEILSDRIEYHLTKRAGNTLEIGAIVFSNKYGYLFETGSVKNLKPHYIRRENE